MLSKFDLIALYSHWIYINSDGIVTASANIIRCPVSGYLAADKREARCVIHGYEQGVDYARIFYLLPLIEKNKPYLY